MYNEHFGFRESPFSAAPSARFFYSNDLYREALASLRYGIEWRKGLIVMTGEVGTGKTTLLGKIMRGLEATMHPIVVSYDHLTYFDLLRFISKELGLPGDGRDRLATIEQLREHLIARHKEGHVVALLIDEAQSLSDEMFEGIRFLSNLETEEGKLLQIVLAGQPELERRLDELSLRNLKQRIVVHCRLAPLKDDEVSRYIEGGLKEVGSTGKEIFAADAVRQIASYSGGIPRLINIICDNALLLAYAQSKDKVTPEMIQEVARDLGLKEQSPTQTADSPTAVANAADGMNISNFRGDQNPIEFKTGPRARRKNGWVRITTGVSFALAAIAGVGGALYSWQIRHRFQPVPVLEDRLLVTQELPHQLGEFKPAAESVAPPHAGAETPGWPAIDVEAVTSETDQPRSKDQQVAAKEEKSRLGNFEVTEPFSFVRSAPRSNAKIIATLKPGTEIEVVSRKGPYFSVRATVDGHTIRGYVHREDAFFGRVRNDRQREAGTR